MAGHTVSVSAIAQFADAALLATDRVGGRTVDLRAGGLTVRIQLAGERICATLAPGVLTSPSGEQHADSRLFVFDSASSGVGPPQPPWPQSAFDGRREEIHGFTEPPRIAIYNLEYATLSYYDELEATGVQWFRDAAQMMPGEGGSPLRNLLRWAFGQHGAHMLHMASASGVLLGGHGGAGKSTSSLACALAGGVFTSDDFTLVTLDDRPRAHAVYSHVKATDETLTLLPGIEELGVANGRDWNDKLRIDVSSAITRSQDVNAIVLPERATRTGRPREIAPAEALRRLTGGSLLVMTGALGRSMAAIGRLLELLPAYVLPVGPDTDRVVDEIAALGAIGAA